MSCKHTKLKYKSKRTGVQGLLELVSLGLVSDGDRVQVLGGADLELGGRAVLLDADGCNVNLSIT